MKTQRKFISNGLHTPEILPLFYHSKDIEIFETLSRYVSSANKDFSRIQDNVLMVGRYFLETPYTENTLETAAPEKLVINLREMDCVTFIENTAVLARLIKDGKLTFEHYTLLLQTMRYRKGMLPEYVSRLHYFSDWIRDNQRKKMMKDITESLGGKPLSRKIHFMTTHRDQYPALKNEKTYRKIRAIEKNISRRSLYSLPKARLPHVEDKIMDGDLIAITTHVEGLDIAHAGLAIRLRQKLHLLHASKITGKVIISDEPLHLSLTRHQTHSGVMVARIS
jgi:hypothetical protein